MLKDTINLRKRTIINKLLNAELYITGKDLAEELKLSVKTVQNEIKEINCILKNYGCEVVSKKGLGYKIQYRDYEQYSQLKAIIKENTGEAFPTIEKNRVEWLIKKLALLYVDEERVSIKLDELSDELFISMSTLKNDLKIVRNILNEYELELSRYGNSGVGIKGEEAKFRYFISEYIVHKNDCKDHTKFFELISKEMESTLKNEMIKIIKQYNLNVTDLGFENLFNHIIITVTRIKSNKFITYSTTKNMSSDKIEYKASEELCRKVSEYFSIEFSEEEISYVYEYLKAQNKLVLEQHCELDKEDERNLILVKKALEEIHKKMGIDFTNDNILVLGLVTHLKSLIHRIKLGMKIKNDMLYEIKKSYLLAFELAEILALLIEEENDVIMDENEIGFLTLHFGGALERMNLNKNKSVLRVVVICASGMGTSILIKSKLISRFGKQIEVVGVHPSYNVGNINLDEIDLIISTVNLQLKRKPVIQISPLLVEEDINKLEHFISKGSENYKINISSLFKDDLFSVDVEFKDRVQAVEFMANRMFELGYIDENMKKSFIDRENLGTTEIGNMVAIPHAVVENVKVPCIYPCILKKPIKWVYGEVQLIFMLALDKKIFIEHEDIFLNIYEKINESHKVKDIISKKNLNYIRNIYY